MPVKYGLGRYMGRLLHPSHTGPAIEEAVKAALSGVKTSRPFIWEEPTRVKVQFNRSEEADMGANLPGVERLDAFTLAAERESFLEAHRIVWNLMAMSFQGIGTQQ